MRQLIVLFATIFALGCVTEEPPECDFEDGEVACTCDDGTEGELQCNDGLADCICDGGEDQ